MLTTVVSPVIAVAFASCRSASPSPKEETTPPAAIIDRLLADERQRIEVFRRACPSIVHVESLMVRRDPAHLNVLEIPSGWAQKIGLKPGLKVKIEGTQGLVPDP